MTEAKNCGSDQTAQFSPAGFLLRVKADTAPAGMLFDGIRDLYAMLSPIAESNRLFLESIVPVLADSANVQARAAAVEAVRAGLLFEHVQTQLIAVMDQMNSDNTARLVTAAELAQAWGYLALSLSDETNCLRELVIDIAA